MVFRFRGTTGFRPVGAMSHDDQVNVQPTLVGRKDECAYLRGCLERARSGASTAAVLTGEAGIGKTSLLRWCEGEAPDFLVVGTRGTTSEVHLSYVGLYDVLAPMLATLDEIPERHAAVIRGALALGPAVSAPPLELVVSVLGLLSRVTAQQPLLIVVDDAQWVDDSTLSCLTVVARRLHSEGVIALFGARPLAPEEQTRAAGLDALPKVPVSRLTPAASTALLSRLRPDVRLDHAERILRDACGNPLAISVLGRFASSSAQQDVGVDERLDMAFAHELAQLHQRGRRAVEVTAVVGETTTGRLQEALHQVGLDLRDLDQSERLGLVQRADARVSFAHPLIRAAVSRSLRGPLRRDLHRVAAHVLDRAVGPLDAERRMWHLAEAADGLDETLASDMEALATHAVARSSPASAVRLLERAAALTGDARKRTDRLLRAADLLQVAGLVADSGRMLAAAAEGADPLQALMVEHRRVRFQVWAGSPGRGRDSLMNLADACRSQVPAEAATMYGHAVLYSTNLGDFDRAVEAAKRADAICSTLDEPLLSVEAAAALLDHLQGRPSRARARLERCAALIEAVDPLSTEQLPLIVGLCRFLDNDTAGRSASSRTARWPHGSQGRSACCPSSCPGWPSCSWPAVSGPEHCRRRTRRWSWLSSPAG
jgi:hypothetical protein